MSMQTSVAFWLTESGISVNVREADALSMALQLYGKSSGQALRRRLVTALSGRSPRLAELSQATTGAVISGRHDDGLQTVRIDRIIGSENRSRDFDPEFHPVSQNNRQRWLSVAQARVQGVALPAVELIQVGESYFVRDGHHRVSVARALGEEFIEARVTVWMYAPMRSSGGSHTRDSGNPWSRVGGFFSWTINRVRAGA